jgi:uncharacterized protein (TIRG00374 family)
MATRRHTLAVLLGLAGTGFFLWLALSKVDFAQLLNVLARVDWRWLLPMALIIFLDLLIRALRWRVLLNSARRGISVWELFQLEAAGLSINNLFFLRLGEFARAMFASKRLQIPILTSLASIVMERVLDSLTLLAFFLIADAIAPGYAADAAKTAVTAILAGGLFSLLILAFAEDAISQGGFIERMLQKWPMIHKFLIQLSLGAAVLRKPWDAMQAITWSIILWSVDALCYLFGAYALGLEEIIDYPKAVLALTWAGASSILPAAPGAIGSYEAAVSQLLGQFGVSPEQSFAFAVLCHMVSYLVITLTGLVVIYRIGDSLTDLPANMESAQTKPLETRE